MNNRQKIVELYRQIKLDRERFQQLVNGPVTLDAKELEAALDHAFSAEVAPDQEQASRQWDELQSHISSLGIAMAETVLYPPLQALMTYLEENKSELGGPEHERFKRAYDCFGRSRWLRDYDQARPLYLTLADLLFQKEDDTTRPELKEIA